MTIAETIELGKQIVRQLDIDPQVDLPCRWLSHFLAEQISAYEKADGVEKEAKGKECVELILRIWENRRSLPGGRRPFESFEPIFYALQRLGDDATPGTYLRILGDKKLMADETPAPNDNVAKAIRAAEAVDDGAKVLVRLLYESAAVSAMNDDDRAWIETIKSTEPPEYRVIINLLGSSGSEEDQEKRIVIDTLQRQIESLEGLDVALQPALSTLQDELKALQGK